MFEERVEGGKKRRWGKERRQKRKERKGEIK